MADSETSPSSNMGNSNKRTWRSEAWDWLKTLIAAFAVVLIVHFFVFNLSTVEGHSMEPTLVDNEWLFVNKFVYLVGKPKVGDVVILKEPDEGSGDKKFLVKRIIGVPGDRIEIYDNQLYRNGELVTENYIDTSIEGMNYGPSVVEEGRYFVMGDNRHLQASLDSRIFGTVPRSLIQGRADYILWPYHKIRGL
ncbi:signal peptidase I [Paenibacillus harenae]|uniref:signal peptidase I n=1 Tax=Paenibacillus harenae TaxID=306543 RepID=UPI00278FB197|nr:signal peptidase I [Paenibacillus harenae]MDQ0063157.1 signal peptidase I [Paenibacillus harenae]